MLVLAALNVGVGRRHHHAQQHLRTLQAERDSQLHELAQYRAVAERVREVSNAHHTERVQIFSMLEKCRHRKDFVISEGPRIACYHTFLDYEQREPTIFLYVPLGQHQLWFTHRSVDQREEMASFMFERNIGDWQFETIDLTGPNVYEIRFDKIEPEEPLGMSFQVIGSDANGADTIVSQHALAFSAPVVGVGGGYGESRIICLPQPSTEMHHAMGVPPRDAFTPLVSQSFRLQTSSPAGPDAPGPRGGVRFFVVSKNHTPDLAARVWEDMITAMRQPDGEAATIVDVLFQTSAEFRTMVGALDDSR